MRTIQKTAIALFVYSVVEGLCWVTGIFGDIRDIADEGPDMAQEATLFIHLPGLLVAQALPLRMFSFSYFAAVETVTLLQVFCIAWLAIAIWDRVCKFGMTNKSLQATAAAPASCD
jgi:hypothetical protein